ncbi:MAG: TonB-dependent siderophore receptor [Alcanivorax sp.]|nr:TonB-dependent siderophore receptor [Alcanivorax sp.]MAY11186.1 TonB-dependent siderophore receptor [Alcanivorax sp.]MBI54403.1 TonB-dependent siderophore receptor [Alcanivorax sp.]HCE38477.1 TonB-dependent siderophore receptor [Alcanivorax sp.]
MRPTFFRLSALSLAVLAATAHAQSSARNDDGGYDLEAIQVQSSADASKGGLSEAFAGGQVAEGGKVGILGTQDVMDTPYSYTTYTEQLIEDQQAASVGEILLNDPAVRVARGFGNYQQVYLVRGLPVYSDDITYNGLYGLLPRQYLASEFIQRVQVFRGANTFLKGAAPGGSSLGGAVNIVPKRAPNQPLNQVTLGAQSGGQAGLAADFANRSEDGRFGIRLNVARHDGDTAVDGEEEELSMAHIGLDFREEVFRLSADLGFQKHRVDGGQPSITFAPGVPILDTPDADESIGQSWTFSDANDIFGTLRAEYDFADNITGWAAIGARRGEEDSIFANPTVNDAGGNYTAYRFETAREDSVLTGETGVRFTFDTGAVGHTLTISGATYELESDNAFDYSAIGGVTGNIYNPGSVPLPPLTGAPGGGDLNDPGRTIKTRFQSVALADQLSMLEDRLLVTLGARYQSLKDYAYDYDTGARLDSSYDEEVVTPTVGVLYKLTPSVSVYANYIEGLQKGERVGTSFSSAGAANAGEVLDPYETEQAEVGVKYQGEQLGGSVSVYRSSKPIVGMNDANVYEELYDQDNTGVELMAYGNLTRDLSVLGGVSFLDADADGNDAIGSPDTQANLNLEYRVPQMPDLAVDGRVIYTSSQYADEANDQKVDSWTRLDLGARYLIALSDDKFLTLRGRVENVTGEDYWASAGGYPGEGYLTIGAPRTVLVSATLDF